MTRLIACSLIFLAACDAGKDGAEPTDDGTETDPTGSDDTDTTPVDDNDTTQVDDTDTTPVDDTDTTQADDTDTTQADDTDTSPGDADGDGSPDAEDCADDDASIFPGAAELCDGVDQDCTPGSELGLASFHPGDATAPTALTDTLSAGGTFNATTSGALHLCGGTWTGSFNAAAGVSARILAQAGHGTPTWSAGGLTLDGTTSVEGVSIGGIQVIVGASASVTLEDVELVGGYVYMHTLSNLVARRVHARDTSTYFLIGTINDLPANPPVSVTIEDSTFDAPTRVYAVYGRIAATIRGSTLTGDASFGAPWDITVTDSTSERGSLFVAGDDDAQATLERVTFSAPTNQLTFRGLGRVRLEDVTVTPRDVLWSTGFYNIDDLSFERVAIDDRAGVLSGAVLVETVFDDPTALPAQALTIGGTQGNGMVLNGPITAEISDSTFEDTFDSCLDAFGVTSLTVTDTTFQRCTGGAVLGGVAFTSGGGAVMFDASSGRLNIASSTFNHNATPYGDGGAIYLRAGTLSVTDSTFTANEAAGMGGAVLAHRGGTFTDCVFDENTAGATGGAISTAFGTLTVTGGRITRNRSAWINSGAVHVQVPTTFTQVDFGAGADDNTPADVSLSTGAVSWEGVPTASCGIDACVGP